MSTLTGARLKGQFLAASGGDPIIFGVTSVSFNVEERAQIDVTVGSDDTQHAVPGRKGISTVSIGARIPNNVADMILMLDTLVDCGTGTLTLTASNTSCNDVSILGGELTEAAWLMSYSVEGSLDSSVDITLNFLLDVPNVTE